MARRHAAFVLAALAFAIGGCTAGSGQPVAAWRTPGAVSGQGGGNTAATHSAAPHTPQSSPAGGGSPGPDTPPVNPGGSTNPTGPGSPSPSGGPHGPMNLITRTGSAGVALTFDDGPGPYTDQMLDLLDRYHIKATFCLIGRQVHAYAAQVRRMVADGMTLCNHTWDHDEKLKTRPDDRIRDELVRTNQAIHDVVPDAKIEYFRNPGGEFGPNTVAIAQSLGMKPLMWSVDPRDWATPGTGEIIENVLHHAHRGSIVLSHDGGGDRSETITAYQTIIPNLRRKYQLVALPVV
ncbi:MAG TPA: polysaccharide deacetylase family protein [Rugosimonospora sp.]|nr:polysaccharide deacetylase family protein [Rugosimonospora sp.]